LLLNAHADVLGLETTDIYLGISRCWLHLHSPGPRPCACLSDPYLSVN